MRAIRRYDDRLEPDYVSTLCAQIESKPDTDCIVFDVAVYFNGQFIKLCKYGKEYSLFIKPGFESFIEEMMEGYDCMGPRATVLPNRQFCPLF
jgi:hypothetical protein